MLRRSPELEEEDVVDMMRLLPSPLPASEDAALLEITKDPGYEALLGFIEGFGPSLLFFSRRNFWWHRGACNDAIKD